MNNDEVKQTLLLYRPGTSDDRDPETAAALAIAKADPELSRWLEEHCARQIALRDKFRQLPVLAGLKEQIISEEAAKAKAASRRERIVGVFAVAAIVAALIMAGSYLFPHKPSPSDYATLSEYKIQMAYHALSNYGMDLTTNDPGQIQSFLAKRNAPSDYVLPAGLQNIAMTGCAIQNWEDSKASMICFCTGKLPPGGQHSDLWLFVVDRTTVKDISTIPSPKFDKVNGLTTVAWTQGNNLYLLGAQTDEETLKKFL